MSFKQQAIFALFAFAPTFLLLGIIAAWVFLFQGKSKAPVKDKLLRYPGRTLYQRLDQFEDQILNRVFWMLVYGPVCFFFFALYIKLRLGAPHLQAEAICFALIVVAITILLAKRAIKALERYRNDALGFRGERAVGEELNKLMLDGCLVYHDVPGEGDWNVDHVVVAPSGVYAIETKTRSKSKLTKDRKDYEVVYDGKTLQYPNWNDTHGLEQAKANAKWLAKHLSNTLADAIKVTPILTLPGWFVTSNVRPNGNELRVLNHKQIRSVIVDGRTPVIDQQRLKQIGYQLELKCRDVQF